MELPICETAADTLITSGRRTTQRREGPAFPEVLALLVFLWAPVALADTAALKKEVDLTLPLVAEILGVPAPMSVKVAVVSRAQAKKKLLEGLARDYPGDALTRLGEALIAIGLAAPGTDLAALAPPFYSETADGFYDLKQRTLYLLDDAPAERQAAVIAHELTHAVQDAQLNLQKLYTSRTTEDGQLALSAVLEGQAQTVAAEVLRRRYPTGTAGEDVARRMVEIAVESAREQAEQAPTPWLGLQLSFPYSAGSAFMHQRAISDDPFGRAVWKHLPECAAQLAEPDLEPARADFKLQKLLPGSKRPWSNSLGRAALGMLGEARVGFSTAHAWRGDRIESVQLDGKPAVVWAVQLADAEAAFELTRQLKPRGHVTLQGTLVILLSGVPESRRGAVLEAAAAAFKPVRP